MEKNYTLWERFVCDTPVFFKKIQQFGLWLLSLGAALSAVPGVPAKITTVMVSAGTAIAAVAQFTVKQYDGAQPAATGSSSAEIKEAALSATKFSPQLG